MTKASATKKPKVVTKTTKPAAKKTAAKKASTPAAKNVSKPTVNKATKPAAKKTTRPASKKVSKPASKKASKKAGGDPNAAWWMVLEAAWKEVAPEHQATRANMAANEASEDDYERVGEALEEVVEALKVRFEEMDAPALLEVDRALERVLYQLDQQEIQEVTDGSDDGFLYCRGFIAGVGQAYVAAVLEDPSVARVDCEIGDICYLPFHVYEARFGKMPRNQGGISRESCSNPEGWAS